MDFDPVKAGLGVPVDQKASASTNTQKDFDPVSSGLGVPVNGLPTSNVSDRGINWIDKFSGVSSMEGDGIYLEGAAANLLYLWNCRLSIEIYHNNVIIISIFVNNCIIIRYKRRVSIVK